MMHIQRGRARQVACVGVCVFLGNPWQATFIPFLETNWFSFHKSQQTKQYPGITDYLPIGIVECNCIDNIFVSLQYMQLFSWGCIPHFTSSIIASCYETKGKANSQCMSTKYFIWLLLKALLMHLTKTSPQWSFLCNNRSWLQGGIAYEEVD